jgi:ABC-2 type transport system permease protein
MTASSPPTAQRVAWSGRVLLALIVSEYRKTASTSAWWALLVPAALICGLIGLIYAEVGGLAFNVQTTLALALSSFGSKFAVIFGVVCSSAEFRHRTITTSYLTASGRPQLLVAKAALSAAVGAGYAVVCSVVGVLGMLIGGGSFSNDFSNDFSDALGVTAVAVLLFALWAVLGVGLGALLANQLSAIIGLLVYLLLVEQLISEFARLSDLGRIQDYLPGGAASASLTVLASGSSFGFGDLFSVSTLPWWMSLLIFLGYTLVVYAAGMAVAQSRDIT